VNAHEFYEKVHDHVGEANVSYSLGELELKLSNFPAARQHYEEGLGLYQQMGNHLGEANVLRGMGDLELTVGNDNLARGRYLDALKLFQQEHNKLGEAAALLGLGRVDGDQRDFVSARQHFADARRLFQEVMDRLGEAHTDFADGLALEALGQKDAAVEMFDRAGSLYTTVGLQRLAASATQQSRRVAAKLAVEP
jgi:tetratricopeptide (TPR) repeat protein